ncbi:MULTISPECIES: sensor domain-containing diguanylate cyclase [Gulbenkiania]|uniref:diguanylate cyclase n=1 Tax=Gulbenkiania indica TaxID=375574 RepID=A0A0K6GX15_9NEIS|nr:MULTISPECIES: sensor domain-containing diguanylate cyclase [Gulbenkiania]CUA83287.1 diguanylate cyclase (GGDEF) domain [Gulbenkiania indica]
MKPVSRRRNLQGLILLIALTAMVLTLINSTLAARHVLAESLIRNTLEAHRVYAAKVASNTEGYMRALQQTLQAESETVLAHFDDPPELQRRLDRVFRATDSFNQVVAFSSEGRLLAAAPAEPLRVGKVFESYGIRLNLSQRQPLITEPYMGANGKLMIFVGQPLFDRNGSYLGYYGGSILLHERNILYSQLKEHAYRDGSYLFVVDHRGHLLYHPEVRRVDERVDQNPVVQRLLRGETGAAQVTNSRGVHMLTGYAPIPSLGWGVVSQRPRDAALAELDLLTLSQLRHAAPLLVAILLAVWWMSRQVARPLTRLAEEARHLDAAEVPERIRRIPGWYLEAQQLKLALLAGVQAMHSQLHRFRRESNTDPLTGLGNRREFDAMIAHWKANPQRVAVVVLDVDHFKNVNDTYGHETGDQVLVELARLMRETARDSDILCRMGGEEFVLILPHADAGGAFALAERLRLKVEAARRPDLPAVTISVGVACCQTGEDAPLLLGLADAALYQAKEQGRNRVVMAPPPRPEA